MKTPTKLLKRFIATLLFSSLVLVFSNSPAAGQSDKEVFNSTNFNITYEMAKMGDAESQYWIGYIYQEGKGVPQDYVEAVRWYRKAAKQGNAIAQLNLGSMYDKGQGVPQDYTEAVKWYRRAAEQGNSKAQSNLGLMYSNSEGVPQDYIEAHKWYNLAASRSQGEVHENSVHNRDITEKRMTPAQVAEAQKLAREWKPKPAQ